MQNNRRVFLPFSATILILCLVVKGQDFSFPSGKLESSHLNYTSNVEVSSGVLTLDGSTSDAQALYSSPISLNDPTTKSVLSFATFFSFSSNSTSGNGTIAFVVVPELGTQGLASARKTLSIEFNTSCSGGPGDNTSYPDHQWRGMGGHNRGGGYGGGQMGGFQVLEYAGDTSIGQYQLWGYGPNWNGQPADGPYFCSQEPDGTDYPTYQYQVVLEYNATTQEVSVGSPSCGAAIARVISFNAQNLSAIITQPVYVGFIVANGAVYNVSQWNFTGNANASTLTSLALSAGASASTDSGSGSGNSPKKLSKGYVAAFSVLGAGIGVAAVFAVCCLCRKRRPAVRQFVAKPVHSKHTIPDDAIIFEPTKPHAPVKIVEPVADRDTAPLNTNANSAFQDNTGTASWLQPVVPR